MKYSSEELVKKVGGKFRLVTLVQRRIRELQRGAKPLVDIKSDELKEIVYHEIMEDKIDIELSDSESKR